MINSLIEKILVKLEENLGDVFPGNPGDHMAIGFLGSVTKNVLPFIKIIPGNLQFINNMEDDNKVDEGVTTARKEFNQQFQIKVYDKEFAMTEKISSLLTAIIQIEEDKLITKANANENVSGEFSTRHIFTGIEVNDGSPNYLEQNDQYIYKLMFTAKGYIDITKTITEGFEKIAEVVINNNTV